MIVAVIDVGSNSVRLLVADTDGRAVRQLRRERVYLRLGDDTYRLGRISREKLDEIRVVIASFARIARQSGATKVETIVTAPGRQAKNAVELEYILTTATRSPVVLLSAEEEGRLAWEGAVARAPDPADVVAVVDLGGGSCELAVGSPNLGPVWIRSFETGALRVTRATLGGAVRPEPARLSRMRADVARVLADGGMPPLPNITFAVGGTARAVAKILGHRFEADALAHLVDRVARLSAGALTERFGVTKERAETLLGGAMVLSEVSRLIGTDLELGRGGLREGAVLALAREDKAAA